MGKALVLALGVSGEERFRTVRTLATRILHVGVTGCDVSQKVHICLWDLRAKFARRMIHSSIPVLVVPMIDVFTFRAEGDVAGTTSERVLAFVDGIDVVSEIGGRPVSSFAGFALEWPMTGVTA